MKRIGLLAIILAFALFACIHEFSFERTVAVQAPPQTIDEAIPQLGVDADEFSVSFRFFDADKKKVIDVGDNQSLKDQLFRLDGNIETNEVLLISYARGDINKLSRLELINNVFGCRLGDYKMISTEQVLKDLDDNGFRPATFDEMIAFLVAHPTVHNTWIMALGSSRGYEGNAYHPGVLREWERTSFAVSAPFEGEIVVNTNRIEFLANSYNYWCTELHQFLAVPKN